MKTETRNTRARLLTAIALLLLPATAAVAQDLNNDARIRARMERSMRRDSAAQSNQSAEPVRTARPVNQTRPAQPADTLRSGSDGDLNARLLERMQRGTRRESDTQSNQSAEPVRTARPVNQTRPAQPADTLRSGSDGDLNARLLERMQRGTRRDSTATNDEPADREEQVIYQPIPLPTEPLTMSDRALYWSRFWDNSANRFPRYYTFRDTIIVNPLFMPVLFKKKNLDNVRRIVFYHPTDLNERLWERPLYRPVQPFKRTEDRMMLRDYAYRYVRHYHPNYFRHSADDLPVERTLRMRFSGNVQVPVYRFEHSAEDYDAPPKFIPDRRYWTSSFESSLRFSQNYVSPNWYKEGTSNMNILTKNLFQYDYARDRIQVKNLLQIDVSVYTASDDSLRNYKFGDNLLRFYSNFGYRAFSKWFYTLDGEFKAPLFTNYKKSTTIKQVALFSPFIVNVGLGMKYDLEKKFRTRGRSLKLAVNVAPISYTYMYSLDNAIDRSPHGFPKDATGAYEHVLHKIGSTVRMDILLKPNRNVTWKSRLYYNTTYKNVLAEFENSLDMAISRFFSTMINVYLRFDDSVTKTPGYDSYVQTNEILSFGFSYKW